MNKTLKKLEKKGLPIKLDDIYTNIENSVEELKKQIKLVKHLSHLEKKNSRNHLLDVEEITYHLESSKDLFEEIIDIIKQSYQNDSN